MAERFEDVEVVSGRPVLYFTGIAAMLVASYVTSPVVLTLALFLGGFAVVAANALLRKTVRGQLVVDREHVSIGRLRFTRSRLDAARVGGLAGTTVHLGTRLAWLWRVRLPSADDAARLLAALGQDESQLDATFGCHLGEEVRGRLRNGRIAGQAGAALLAVALIWLFRAPVFASLVTGVVAGVIAGALVPAYTVTVSRDGVHVRRGRRDPGRFVPYAEVDRVSMEGDDVVVTLSSGAPPLIFGFDASLVRRSDSAMMLFQRIEAARRLAARTRIELVSTSLVRVADAAYEQELAENELQSNAPLRTAG
jgi:hypothetical protein